MFIFIGRNMSVLKKQTLDCNLKLFWRWPWKKSFFSFQFYDSQHRGEGGSVSFLSHHYLQMFPICDVFLWRIFQLGYTTGDQIWNPWRWLNVPKIIICCCRRGNNNEGIQKTMAVSSEMWTHRSIWYGAVIILKKQLGYHTSSAVFVWFRGR